MSAARRTFVAVFAVAVILSSVGAGPAVAVEPLSIDYDQILSGEAGTEVELASTTVAAEQIGSPCTLSVHTENQSSVHPGNDLVIRTGDTTSVIADVEAQPDGGRDLSTQVVLGPDITVGLRFGPDQVSSMGFRLEISCEPTPDVAASGLDCAEATVSPCGADAPVQEAEPEAPPVEAVTPSDPAPSGPCAQDGAQAAGQDTAVVESDPASPGLTLDGDQCGPEVLGLQIERLPESPAAQAVPAAPSYAG